MGGEQSEASQHPCRHRRPEGEPATTYEHVIEVLGASRLKGFDRNIADVLGGGHLKPCLRESPFLRGAASDTIHNENNGLGDLQDFVLLHVPHKRDDLAFVLHGNHEILQAQRLQMNQDSNLRLSFWPGMLT